MTTQPPSRQRNRSEATAISSVGLRATRPPAGVIRIASAVALFHLTTALASLDAHAQNVDSGKTIFTTGSSPPCALCHILADAGATGEIGPNLDELKPTEEKVRRAVKRGLGNMPTYDETLTDEQIAAVAQYVAQATGR